MKTLWRYVDSKSLPSVSKQKLFLFLHMMMWMVIALILSLAIGRIGALGNKWLEISVIVVGYASFGIGFLGGWLFISNHT